MKTKLSVLLFGCLMLALSPLASTAATSSFITHGRIEAAAFILYSLDSMYLNGFFG